MRHLATPSLPPRTEGVMTRLAVARLRCRGLDPRPIAIQAGLSLDAVDDPKTRLDVRGQVALLDLAAEALDDPLLGFHLAQEAELRQVGLLYFVLASSATFREALAAVERYGAVLNEGVALHRLSGECGFAFDYVGIPRHADRHQAESCATALLRIARETTGTALNPVHMTFAHPRCAASAGLDVFFRCPIAFGADRDVMVFRPDASDLPIVRADSYLHDLLVGYCEAALAHRTRPFDTLRTRVENAAAALLPHGKARVGDVARKLGLSQRTLARRLAVDGLTFATILDELRISLARHYLRDPGLSISEIAWLLGFQEVSAFTHAFKRWTGIPPSQARSRPNGSGQSGMPPPVRLA